MVPMIDVVISDSPVLCVPSAGNHGSRRTVKMLHVDEERICSADVDVRAVVLVEGTSDQFALQALAERRGRNLAAEENYFRRSLERAGFGTRSTRAEMEALGFYVCVADLEDELIRSLGFAAVEQVLRAQGDLGSFRIVQQQPAQRGRTTEQQLRRFMGTRSRRKRLYARLLVEALDLESVPRPLDGVLAHF